MISNMFFYSAMQLAAWRAVINTSRANSSYLFQLLVVADGVFFLDVVCCLGLYLCVIILNYYSFLNNILLESQLGKSFFYSRSSKFKFDR